MDSTVSSSSEDEETTEDDSSPHKTWDLHSIDTESIEFKSLPVDVRHEILTDLKETRKQSSWGRINELPTESDDFSIYQMKRLLKRQSVQSALEEAEKEMGGHTLSLGDLEKLMQDQGVIGGDVKGNRIASDENTRYLLIKDIKQAVEDAKKLQTIEEETSRDEGKKQEENKIKIKATEEFEDLKKDATKLQTITEEKLYNQAIEEEIIRNKATKEFEEDLKKAIALSLLDEPSTSRNTEVSLPTSEEESSEDEELLPKLTTAKSYMLEYSGLTPNEITKILENQRGKAKSKGETVIRGSNPSSNNMEKLVTVLKTPELLVSDSEGSSNEDFLEVSEEIEPSKGALEVVIKVNEAIEGDDLFSDVFKSEEPLISDSFTTSKPKDTISAKEASAEETCTKEDTDTEIKTDTNIELVETREQETITELIKEYTKPNAQNQNTEAQNQKSLTIGQMHEIQENLSKEQTELVAMRSTKERLATNITDQMYQEAQVRIIYFPI